MTALEIIACLPKDFRKAARKGYWMRRMELRVRRWHWELS